MRLAFIIAFVVESALGASLTIPTGLLPGGVWWASNNVGVVGGIPNVTTIYTNLSPSGNDWSNINIALLRCPSNQVVSLNAGTYDLTNSLQFGSGYWFQFSTAGSNGVVLRGAGQGKTILKFETDAQIRVTGNGFGGAFPNTNHASLLTAGYGQGSTNLTLATTIPGLTNGDMICLTEEIDPTLVQPQGNQDKLTVLSDLFSNQCYELQWVRVASVSSGTNLTISPGVYMTNYQSSLRPQVLWAGTHDPAMMCGIENLTINSTNAGGVLAISSIALEGSFNCWVQNVEIQWPWYSGVDINWSAHDTVQGCYFHDSASGGAATSYGVSFNSVSDCLGQNNIFYRITSPGIFVFGASGNVFAYNYCTNMLFGIGPGWMMQSVSFHAAHPVMNLVEGNKGTGVIFDVIHGSSSHNMVFRDWFSGWEGNLEHYTNYFPNDTTVVEVMSSNRYESIIGNVLGTASINTNYQDTVLNYPTNYLGNAVYLIYWLGYWANEGTVSPPTTNSDSVTVTTLWRDGNYDTATLSIVWDANGAVTLPSSLYLTAKPSWWGATAWPPIGSDLTPMVGTIPAQTLFDSMLTFPPAIVMRNCVLRNFSSQ